MGEYAVPVIQKLLDANIPIFGICLGHQLLGLAVGAKTMKMFQGHRGANHPVKRLEDGVVEITSMNHGFAIDNDTLPDNVRTRSEEHTSELQSLMRISYAVFCLNKKKTTKH